MNYISLLTFPGRTGTVIYLKNYLSTMFQISDILADKDEVAMILNIHLTLPDKADSTENISENTHDMIVSEELSGVSKPHIEIIIEKLAKILDSQGVSCFQCPKAKYKLSPLSIACKEADYIRAREGHALKYLELSVQQVRNQFEIEYDSSTEDFLESVYLAGADLSGSEIEHHAKYIEKSHQILKLLDNAIDLMRIKHKHGEAYFYFMGIHF